MTLEDFYVEQWRKKWPEQVLNDPDLARRRKRSHSLKMLSIDKEAIKAEFESSRVGKIYVTTLTSCTCKDFALGRGERPCKHIFRLAEELGLFTVEELSHSVPYERKILPESLHFADDRLVETYINILRFIYRGRRIRIKQFEHALFQRRSEQILRVHDAENTPDWAISCPCVLQ